MATISGTLAAEALTGSRAGDLILGAPTLSPTTTPSVTTVAEGLRAPVFAAAMPGDSGRLLILEKAGLIRSVDTGTGTIAATPFLTITNEVNASGEQGLLGLAFHPDFWVDGRFFVFFSNTGGDSVVREYRVDPANPGAVMAGSGRDILTIPQPGTATNHKGGTLAFGLDGMLFITAGDGGGGRDSLSTGQDPNDLLGSVLRFDVDADEFPDDLTRNYAIPSDNPFVGGVGGAAEVWAYGLRNPYRASVDRGTGTLWIGDVGASAFEEINLGSPGANFGWSLFEGPGGPAAGITFPAHSYGRSAGDETVIAGFVLRGSSSGLQGEFLFGDFTSGRLWTLADRDRNGTLDRATIDDGSAMGSNSLVAFAEDAEGTIFLIGIDGRVRRFNPGDPAGMPDGGDTIAAGSGDDRVFAGAGHDRASGAAGHDLIAGMEGLDTLLGGSGADTLLGGDGGDVLSGGSDADLLNGGPGTDRLLGGDGSDVLLGGPGGDILTGGGGADRFRWVSLADSTAAHGFDRVTDFARAEGDVLDLSAIADGSFTFIGAARFAASGPQVRAVPLAHATRVEVSVDGGPADMVFAVVGTAPLSADDFVL